MAYVKTTWATGDVITAEKLNNMEDGIEAAQLPSVTEDDIGSVLTVVTSYTDYDIAPEQTVTLTSEDASGVDLEDLENTDLLTDQAALVLVVNNSSFNVTYDAISGISVENPAEGITLYIVTYTEGVMKFLARNGKNPAPGEYTVRLYKHAATGATWAPAASGN